MKRDKSLGLWLCICVFLYLEMCNRCSSSSNETLGVEKNKYARLQADMENNNILLSVNNACLWVLYFYIIFGISLSLSKIILLFYFYFIFYIVSL